MICGVIYILLILPTDLDLEKQLSLESNGMVIKRGTTFANKNIIKWETTLTRNLAADITLFNGRLTVTPEIYWNTTKDLLYKSDIPSASGYVSQMQNIGQVTNKRG